MKKIDKPLWPVIIGGIIISASILFYIFDRNKDFLGGKLYCFYWSMGKMFIILAIVAAAIAGVFTGLIKLLDNTNPEKIEAFEHKIDKFFSRRYIRIYFISLVILLFIIAFSSIVYEYNCG